MKIILWILGIIGTSIALNGCGPTMKQKQNIYRDGYARGYVMGLFTCADGKDRYFEMAK